ncbi:hypothetical protein Rmet_6655 (plasmid) [Cupriavidus metallidurans CH34]|uniref:Uncharacterized protein n=1 Tax=Cupriavidus metallidurans (strain ATCC 43123 / DSM 2839 / NBRC 102507 / CH34) TaxID=266264 RepID=D3DY84_CUPMC|nr:hypothetical protein Rmet_6655 [Cupriavidus metallidurans CH34]
MVVSCAVRWYFRLIFGLHDSDELLCERGVSHGGVLWKAGISENLSGTFVSIRQDVGRFLQQP